MITLLAHEPVTLSSGEQSSHGMEVLIPSAEIAVRGEVRQTTNRPGNLEVSGPRDLASTAHGDQNPSK
jgi:hypothetical protein